jgi:RNA polymerase sigma-70 factor (ECF subfamily)
VFGVFSYARARPDGARARVVTMNAEVSEATEIMARYCRGEIAAFQRFYALLAPRILSYLAGMLGDRASGEDALQLTFLKLHEARASYVLGANPIPWLYTIAHRVALDELRRRRRSQLRLSKTGAPDAELQANIAGAAVETSVEPTSPPAEAAAGALAALARLPENQRQALILTKLHGRSVAEAAQITGSTPGAIKQRAHRAYLTLRQLLGNAETETAGTEVA